MKTMRPSSVVSVGASALLLLGKKRHVLEEEQIETLAESLGLSCRRFDIQTEGLGSELPSVLKDASVVATFAAHDVLAFLDHKKVFAGLKRLGEKSIPMLIFGVAAGVSAEELKTWSHGAIQGVETTAEDACPTVFEVSRIPELTGALGGWALPAVTCPMWRVQFGPDQSAQLVVEARGPDRSSPVLVRVQDHASDLFFMPEMKMFDTSWMAEPSGLSKTFASMAALIFFSYYAARDYAWHLEARCANLTIDDPWLTQPYGNLNFVELLREMKRHKFHTSIAFVPWNFDRSKAEVIDLFRGHPEHLSICMHGNDHTHREFGDYIRNPLPGQIVNLEQSIARMERFRVLTGISYDRFMVFPHGIAPEPTLAALKAFNFLGTANSIHVPLGETFPIDAIFLLRTYTLRYARFLSLFRYSADQPPGVEIAINVFLGNPLLFYSHQDLFEEGIDRFNKVADFVNQIQGDTQWVGLGELARQLYEVRRRSSGGFDVRMLSREMNLKNSTSEEQQYYIEHADKPSLDVQSITVGASAVSFDRQGDVMRFRVSIPAFRTVSIRVAYRDDLDIPRQDVRKRRMYAASLRLISDFRDLRLTRSSWGRKVARNYYVHRLGSFESKLVAVCGSVRDAIADVAIRLRGRRRR